MKLMEIKLRGVTRFRNEYALNLAGMGDGLVAIVGANGAGKTTIMECVPATLYREMPTRPGSLYDLCHGTDAYVETAWEDAEGQRVVLRVRIDADRKKTEGIVTVNGAPFTDGKLTMFRETVVAIFGTSDLFYASVFSTQNRAGNFLDMPKGNRKELFAELLGLHRLQRIHEAAKVRLTDVEREILRLGPVAGEADRLKGEVAEMAADVGNRGARLADERVRLAQLQSQLDAACGTLVIKQREEEAFLQASRQANAKADELRTAEERQAELRDRRQSDLEALRDSVQRASDSIVKENDSYEQNRQALDDRIGKARGYVEVVRLGDAAAKVLSSDLKRFQELDKLKAQRGAYLPTTSVLERAPCTASFAWVWSSAFMANVSSVDLAGTCPLLKSAHQAQEFLDANPFDDDAYEALRELVNLPTVDVSFERGWVAMIPDMERQLSELRPPDMTVAHAIMDAEDDKRKAIEEQYAARAAPVRLLIAELKKAASVSAEAADITPYEEAVKEERRAHAAQATRVGTWQRDLDMQMGRLDATEKRLATISAAPDELKHITGEAEQWRLIVRGFGKDGIQALEIDAAGPEVAEVANHLLDACYGGRFSIDFTTLREKKSKPGEYSEVFDVQVMDGQEQRPVEQLSGGEKVIIGEAINLALSIFNSRRGGVRWKTLFRDETAGALDPANAQRYIDMLRRAREVGGFDQIIFVAHLPDVWERADHRVMV